MGLKPTLFAQLVRSAGLCHWGAFRSADLWWLLRISRLSWLGTTWNTRRYRPRSLGSPRPPRLLNIRSNRIRDIGPWHSFATELGIHQSTFDTNKARYIITCINLRKYFVHTYFVYYIFYYIVYYILQIFNEFLTYIGTSVPFLLNVSLRLQNLWEHFYLQRTSIAVTVLANTVSTWDPSKRKT